MSINSEKEGSDSGEAIKVRVTITIADSVLEKGRELAKIDNRSLSNYLETLVLEKSDTLEKVEVSL